MRSFLVSIFILSDEDLLADQCVLHGYSPLGCPAINELRRIMPRPKDCLGASGGPQRGNVLGCQCGRVDTREDCIDVRDRYLSRHRDFDTDRFSRFGVVDDHSYQSATRIYAGSWTSINSATRVSGAMSCSLGQVSAPKRT